MNFKRTIASISILGVALLLSAPSFGYIVDRLYEADLITKSKDVTEREAVFSEALEQVLTRISGRADVANHPLVMSALKNPNKFVQQYAYHGDVLEATFNPGLIQSLLSDAQFPIWSQSRPELVLWLAIDSDDERRLVGVESDPGLVALIEKNANLRGLPIIVPLMDLEDMSKVTVTDVVGEFPSALEQASERYGYNGLLVARLQSKQGEQTGVWHTNWKLIIDGQTFSWESENTGLNEAIKIGVDGVIEHLASLYAVLPSQTKNQAVLLMVEDISSVSDYAKAMQYLKGLSHVQEVLVHQVEANRAIFKIIPKQGGNLKVITSSMDLDDRMVALALSRDADATYRWISRDS